MQEQKRTIFFGSSDDCFTDIAKHVTSVIVHLLIYIKNLAIK